jgi:hypothetical protein
LANSPASPCARTTAYRRAADNFELFVGTAFGALVASLKSLRGAGIVEHDVLLVVLSTDPGPRLEELALRCVDELNSESVASTWRKAMGF